MLAHAACAIQHVRFSMCTSANPVFIHPLVCNLRHRQINMGEPTCLREDMSIEEEWNEPLFPIPDWMMQPKYFHMIADHFIMQQQTYVRMFQHLMSEEWHDQHGWCHPSEDPAFHELECSWSDIVVLIIFIWLIFICIKRACGCIKRACGCMRTHPHDRELPVH